MFYHLVKPPVITFGSRPKISSRVPLPNIPRDVAEDYCRIVKDNKGINLFIV